VHCIFIQVAFPCKSHIFRQRFKKVINYKWGEVKDFWSVVTKRPKMQGSKKWGVMLREVRWSEVKWCELSLNYIYVAVCSFCAVRCLIVICVSLLFSNYWTCYFNIPRMFVFLFCMCLLFSVSCVFVLFFESFLLLYIAVSFLFFCTSLPITATGWKPNCSK
jgi:hypothetical protein